MHKQQRFYGLLALCMTVWFAAQFAYQWWIYAPDPTAHTVLTIANIAQQIVVMLLLCFTLVTNTNRASVVHPDDITPPEPTIKINGKPYGRRMSDADSEAVHRVISHLERKPNLPLADDAPEWARDVMHANIATGKLDVLDLQQEGE